MINTTMRGRVLRRDGAYYCVQTDGALAHLQVLWLADWQMHRAVVGDLVELQYQTNPHGALWNVVRVVDTTASPFVEE